VLKVLQGAALVAATMRMGLMAGVFGLYAHAIMPGLRTTDDPAEIQQSLIPPRIARIGSG
jgi:hypothetical protein